MKSLALVLGLSSCHSMLAGTPDLVAASGPIVYLRGHSPDGVLETIADTYQAAVRVCPDRTRLDAAWKEVEVEFMYADPFECSGRWVHGCQWPGAVQVSSVAVLPDELGHVVWETCMGRTGEDARGKYDPDFSAWLQSVRSEPVYYGGK